MDRPYDPCECGSGEKRKFCRCREEEEKQIERLVKEDLEKGQKNLKDYEDGLAKTN
jgi:hypothetical protein